MVVCKIKEFFHNFIYLAIETLNCAKIKLIVYFIFKLFNKKYIILPLVQLQRDFIEF